MTRRAWITVCAAYLILAIGWLVAISLLQSQADSIEAHQERVETLSINVTAAICLQAYAPEEAEAQIVEDYVSSGTIALDNEICQRAVALAREQVDGN